MPPLPRKVLRLFCNWLVIVFIFLSRPVINEKVEDRLCGWGPTLEFYLKKDEFLADDVAKLFGFFDQNYQAGLVYVKRLEPVRQFYSEDLLIEETDIQNETG